MGWEPGREGRREEIVGQIGGWQSTFLNRMSPDEIPSANCERLLISIQPDWDEIGFGLRLSKSSLAHLIVYSVACLYHTDWHPPRTKRASGTPKREGFGAMNIQAPPTLGTSQVVGA